jgi:hypothetical protein
MTKMKKLKELKNLHSIFVDYINDLDTELQNQLAKIKLEYQQNLIDEKIRLLMTVCNGENLDFDDIKTKYLKNKELNYIVPDKVVKDKFVIEEDLLDKIEIDNVEYYYEPKEKGIVYNSNLV